MILCLNLALKNSKSCNSKLEYQDGEGLGVFYTHLHNKELQCYQGFKSLIYEH